MSRGLIKAEDKNAFMENLEQKNFIVKKEVRAEINNKIKAKYFRKVFHYKTNPARAHLINFIIKIKGKEDRLKVILEMFKLTTCRNVCQ